MASIDTPGQRARRWRNAVRAGAHFCRVGIRGEVAVVGVDLDVGGVDARFRELLHHGGGDRGREEDVRAGDDVEHARADLREMRLGVEAHHRAAQRHEGVRVELGGPAAGHLAHAGLAGGGIGESRGQDLVAAVAAERVHPDGGHRLRDAAAVVVPAAVPVGIGAELGEEGRHRLLVAQAARGGHRRDDAVHEIGIVDAPLKALEAAVGLAGHRHQMAHAQAVEHEALRPHDVAERDVREVRAIRLARRRVDAARARRSIRRAEHVGRDGEVALGVDGLAGADEVVPPPAGRIVRRGRTRRALAAREAVGDEDRIGAVGREAPVRLEGERHLGQRAAALEREVARGEPAIGDGVERGCRGHGRISLVGSEQSV